MAHLDAALMEEHPSLSHANIHPFRASGCPTSTRPQMREKRKMQRFLCTAHEHTCVEET